MRLKGNAGEEDSHLLHGIEALILDLIVSLLLFLIFLKIGFLACVLFAVIHILTSYRSVMYEKRDIVLFMIESCYQFV